MTISDPPPPPRETQRLDAFVDAAFAFAVTLLIIAGAEPLASFQDLQRALMRIPAFAAGFALIAVFWLGHRRFGQIAPRRDGMSVLLSLAIVFWVLVLVFPMRLLTESGAHWLSGRILPGGELLRSLEDLRGVYIVYGLGFAMLAALYVLLFHHALRRPKAVALAPASVEAARLERRVWLIVAGSGVVSALSAALLPIQFAPFLPGFAYWLIPVGLGLAAWLDGRKRHAVPAAQ